MFARNVLRNIKKFIFAAFLGVPQFITLAKFALSILEFNLYEQFRDEKISAHVVHSTADQSFHVVDWTRTTAECTKM